MMEIIKLIFCTVVAHFSMNVHYIHTIPYNNFKKILNFAV